MGERLKHRQAVVTGGGRGIGRAIALAFAREGADVCVTARTASEIEAVAREIEALGRRALAIPADVTDPAAVQRLRERVLGAWDGVDLLVNNAGWGVFKPVLELTLEEWESTLAVHLRGAFLCTQAFAPAMIARGGGVILNVSSMSAYRGAPEYGPYGAAKAALNHLTQTLAAELKPHRIRVVAICPGPTASRLRSHHFPNEDPTRIMQPEVVADLAVFLASDEARGISGAAVNIHHY